MLISEKVVVLLIKKKEERLKKINCRSARIKITRIYYYITSNVSVGELYKYIKLYEYIFKYIFFIN